MPGDRGRRYERSDDPEQPLTPERQLELDSKDVRSSDVPVRSEGRERWLREIWGGDDRQDQPIVYVGASSEHAQDAGSAEVAPFEARETAERTDGRLEANREAREIRQGAYSSDRPLTDAEQTRLQDLDRKAFDPEVARRVPERPESENWRRVRGLLTDEAGTSVWDQPQESAAGGPASELGGKSALRLPDISPVDTHVEAHAAAEMRRREMTYASLYINKVPCPGRLGCDAMLPRMLPAGATLVVYTRDGMWTKAYTGLKEETS